MLGVCGVRSRGCVEEGYRSGGGAVFMGLGRMWVRERLVRVIEGSKPNRGRLSELGRWHPIRERARLQPTKRKEQLSLSHDDPIVREQDVFTEQLCGHCFFICYTTAMSSLNGDGVVASS